MTLLELARKEGKAKVAIAARVDGVVTDLARPLPDGAKVEWVLPTDPDGVEILRHSTAHVMAAAVKELFPDARIIQTHRNPLEVVKSSIQLTQVLHQLYARPGDRDQLAQREEQARRAVDRERGHEHRAAALEALVVHRLGELLAAALGALAQALDGKVTGDLKVGSKVTIEYRGKQYSCTTTDSLAYDRYLDDDAKGKLYTARTACLALWRECKRKNNLR
mgnify:CR=1 FL=1